MSGELAGWQKLDAVVTAVRSGEYKPEPVELIKLNSGSIGVELARIASKAAETDDTVYVLRSDAPGSTEITYFAGLDQSSQTSRQLFINERGQWIDISFSSASAKRAKPSVLGIEHDIYRGQVASLTRGGQITRSLFEHFIAQGLGKSVPVPDSRNFRMPRLQQKWHGEVLYSVLFSNKV